jgi:hypothetical protein
VTSEDPRCGAPCPSRRRPFSAVVKPRLEPADARLGDCVSEATALTRNVTSFTLPPSYAGIDF